jgi:hypothetical protein
MWLSGWKLKAVNPRLKRKEELARCFIWASQNKVPWMRVMDGGKENLVQSVFNLDYRRCGGLQTESVMIVMSLHCMCLILELISVYWNFNEHNIVCMWKHPRTQYIWPKADQPIALKACLLTISPSYSFCSLLCSTIWHPTIKLIMHSVIISPHFDNSQCLHNPVIGARSTKCYFQ